MKWKDGGVAGYAISSPVARKVMVRVNSVIKEAITKKL
jgi:hypothetical protein